MGKIINRTNYKNLETLLYNYTKGFTKEGEYPLKSKVERDNAYDILTKYYDDVEKNHLDLYRNNVNGVDYKVMFKKPKKKELGFAPDKNPENFNKFAETNPDDVTIGSGVFEALVDEDILNDALNIKAPDHAIWKKVRDSIRDAESDDIDFQADNVIDNLHKMSVNEKLVYGIFRSNGDEGRFEADRVDTKERAIARVQELNDEAGDPNKYWWDEIDESLTEEKHYRIKKDGKYLSKVHPGDSIYRKDWADHLEYTDDINNAWNSVVSDNAYGLAQYLGGEVEPLDEGRNDLVPVVKLNDRGAYRWYAYDTEEKDVANYDVDFTWKSKKDCVNAINNPRRSLGYGEAFDKDGYEHIVTNGEKQIKRKKPFKLHKGEMIVNEAPVSDLEARYDSAKSFYKKARVNDENGVLTLYSYNTPVCKIENGTVTFLPRWDESATTLKHVKEFLKQNGFEVGSKSWLAAKYGSAGNSLAKHMSDEAFDNYLVTHTLSEEIIDQLIGLFYNEFLRLGLEPHEIEGNNYNYYSWAYTKLDELGKERATKLVKGLGEDLDEAFEEVDIYPGTQLYTIVGRELETAKGYSIDDLTKLYGFTSNNRRLRYAGLNKHHKPCVMGMTCDAYTFYNRVYFLDPDSAVEFLNNFAEVFPNRAEWHVTKVNKNNLASDASKLIKVDSELGTCYQVSPNAVVIPYKYPYKRDEALTEAEENDSNWVLNWDNVPETEELEYDDLGVRVEGEFWDGNPDHCWTRRGTIDKWKYDCPVEEEDIAAFLKKDVEDLTQEDLDNYNSYRDYFIEFLWEIKQDAAADDAAENYDGDDVDWDENYPDPDDYRESLDEDLKLKKTPYGFSEAEYKGFVITKGQYYATGMSDNPNEITVDFYGDDAYFDSVEDAMEAIDAEAKLNEGLDRCELISKVTGFGDINSETHDKLRQWLDHLNVESVVDLDDAQLVRICDLIDLYAKNDLKEDKHNELNPKLWANNELRPEVVDKINKIVEKFLENLKEEDITLDVKDVYLLGSNANYNYNDTSDLDIHIAADLSQFKGKEKELAQKLYDAQRRLFNNKYDPLIRGIEVELYVEPYEDKNDDGIADKVE